MANIILMIALTMIIAYLLGSISFSIIITKLCKHDDIRNYGSGNAGATNVMRTVGKGAAGLTFLLDFSKCVAAVLIGKWLVGTAFTGFGITPEAVGVNLGAYIAGFTCILGHMFPVFFGFKGGKGVVTTAAMMALIDWRVFCVLFSIFLIVFAARRIVSLASIIGTALYPLGTFLISFFFDYSGSPLASHGELPLWYLITAVILSAMTGAVVVIKHKSNIKRLINGTEKPISFKKST